MEREQWLARPPQLCSASLSWPPRVGAVAGPENAPWDIWRSPLGWTRSTPRGRSGARTRCTLGCEMARRELQIDVAIALATFAGLARPARRRARPTTAASSRSPSLLTALASLPLVVRRRAPLAVFVFTALASTALQPWRTRPARRSGATIALFWVAAASDGSRERTRATVALVLALLARPRGSRGPGGRPLPRRRAAVRRAALGRHMAGGRPRAPARASGWPSSRSARSRAEREAERERRLAAAEERSSIARDLHDSAGHAINVILVHAGAGRLQRRARPGRGARGIRDDRGRRARDRRRDRPDGRRAARATRPARPEVEAPPGVAALDGARGAPPRGRPGRDRDRFAASRARCRRPSTAAPTGSCRRRSPTPPATAAAAPGSTWPWAPTTLELTVANPGRPGAAPARDSERPRRGRHARAGGPARRQPRGRTRATGSFEVHARLPLAGERHERAAGRRC